MRSRDHYQEKIAHMRENPFRAGLEPIPKLQIGQTVLASHRVFPRNRDVGGEYRLADRSGKGFWDR
jgi:hypothetical protein